MVTIEKRQIKDATRKLTLEITKRDISSSKRRSPEACAAAHCILRMEGVQAAQVHKTRTYIKIRGQWVRYMTPGSLRTELVAFDRGGRFEPGEHILLPVPVYERPTGKRQGSANDKRKGGRRSYHIIEGVRYSAKDMKF